MKRRFLGLITVLILIFSSALGYHMLTNESNEIENNGIDIDVTDNDVSKEIDDLLIDENNDVDIGEMI